jgi:hypothetical protein
MSVVQYFDDGTSLITADDGSVSAGGYFNGNGTDLAMAVSNSGSDGTGAFDIFNQFTGLVTKVGGTVLTLQAQADALKGQQAARDLAKYQQDAAVSIAKLNTNREVTLAALKNQSVGLLASPSMLLVLAAAGGLIFFLHNK